MATALPSLLNVSSIQISSSGFSEGHRIHAIARRVTYGGRSVGVARMTKGENDVLVEDKGREKGKEQEPVLLRIGVSFVTELLRLFTNSGSSQSATAIEEVEPAAGTRNLNVVEILREDYERAYFLTGDFTTMLYADDCLFADPTIQFRGRDKYQRNLKLLVPFFEEPRLTLFDIQEEGWEGQECSIKAIWNLRTYLRLPWKPLIDVNGSTLYVIDANSKIVKHIESWSISGWQAVQQLFVPSDGAFSRKRS